jgi:glycosyltransferase involved in cell wall biosynthesis
LEQKLKIIINCGACENWIEKCLRSLRSQTHTAWAAYVSVDPWGDETVRAALSAKDGDSRIFVHVNETRSYSTANLVEAIRRSQADPEDIIVQLDGDDWLYTREALEVIVDTYRKTDCWLTYGSWISSIRAAAVEFGSNGNGASGDWSPQHGKWPAYPEDAEDYRRTEWLATSIRTWKKWLWDLIDDADLRDPTGRYFTVAQDHAIMFPMLEMSGPSRARHISETLMVYNTENPNRSENTQPRAQIDNALYLRGRKPYARLEAVRRPRAGRVDGQTGSSKGRQAGRIRPADLAFDEVLSHPQACTARAGTK